MRQLHVGLMGLGRMGQAVGPRLLAAGFQLSIWNRSSQRCQDLIDLGATLAASPADLGSTCDVILIFTDAVGTRAILSEHPGLLSQIKKSAIVALMATLEPASANHLCNLVENAGAVGLHVPVLGTVAPARAGQLVALVGGSLAGFQAVQPVLAAFCRRLVPIDSAGAAAAMKLSHNLILTNYFRLIGEAVTLGEAAGLARHLMMDVLCDSPAGLPVLTIKAPILLGDHTQVGFDIQSTYNELRFVTTLAETSAVQLPISTSTTAIVKAMVDAGWGERDVASLAVYVDSKLI